MKCDKCGNELIPDSTKCDKLKIKKNTVAGNEYVYKLCTPCGDKPCTEMFGSSFCKHHYKPKGEVNV